MNQPRSKCALLTPAVVGFLLVTAIYAQQVGAAVIDQLVAEALRSNPEIQAAKREREAAEQRVKPAGALDDPMLEAGVVNLPTGSWSFSREDMTMKMIGLAQKFPYPGKRGLREDVASRDADAAAAAVREKTNQVVRDVKTSYFDLAFIGESKALVEKNRAILAQFLQIAESRYSVGQSTQADVLKAQTQLSKMVEELIRLDRERPMIDSELNRALGRTGGPANEPPSMPELKPVPLSLDALNDVALKQRPQLAALQNVIAKNEKSIELARKDYLPDFDVRFQYGQRDRAPDGMKRDDMVSFTVAINLPVWKQNKLGPRVQEAIAMRDQASSMLQAQRNEIYSKLRQQVATAEQSIRSVQLYDSGILPQAKLTVESALAAYRVNRVDLLTLLDNQMTVFNFELGRAQAVVNYNKALAEIDLLTGKETY